MAVVLFMLELIFSGIFRRKDRCKVEVKLTKVDEYIDEKPTISLFSSSSSFSSLKICSLKSITADIRGKSYKVTVACIYGYSQLML